MAKVEVRGDRCGLGDRMWGGAGWGGRGCTLTEKGHGPYCLLTGATPVEELLSNEMTVGPSPCRTLD
jgi:hypothetical protein